MTGFPSAMWRASHRPAALHTLATACEVVGVGLHSGEMARVRLLPSSEHGITFQRSDQRRAPPVVARPGAVVSTVLSTTLGLAGGATIATVEHLLAALCGLRVESCRVEVDAAELPVLDGSAAPWVSAIQRAGLKPLHEASSPVVVREPLWVEESGSWVAAVPAPSPRLTVGIEFEHAPIGRQWASWTPEPATREQRGEGDGAASFVSEVAPARTFALHEQIPALREAGLIRGGSLDNALVCDTVRWLNGPLRFANEPARHKLLDLLGDLALLGGRLPQAHIVAFRASHKLHVRLAAAIEAACTP